MAEEQNDPGDEYERRYMSEPGGEVLLRDKRVSRGFAGLLMVLAALIFALGLFLLLGLDPQTPRAISLVAFAAAALVGFAGLTMGVVRTVVTREQVRVQLGLWGPQVDVARIREATVVDYQPSKFGGWGIRRAFDGTWAYTTPDTARVLSLTWEDDGGELRKAVVSVEAPEAVVAAIQQARQLAASASGARVAVERLLSDEPEAELETDTEQEAPRARGAD